MSLITAPLMFHCWFVLEPIAENDVCWPDRLPPTLAPLMIIPGVCSMITHGSRAFGIFSSASLVKLADSVRRLGVDDRARAGHGNGFLHRGDLEPGVDLRVEARLDDHVAADEFLEAGNLERHCVGADGDAGETIGARFRRHGDDRLDQRRTAQGHRNPREHGAGAVRGLPEDFAGAHLRRCRQACKEQETDERTYPLNAIPHTSSWAAGWPTARSCKRKTSGRLSGRGHKPKSVDGDNQVQLCAIAINLDTLNPTFWTRRGHG